MDDFPRSVNIYFILMFLLHTLPLSKSISNCFTPTFYQVENQSDNTENVEAGLIMRLQAHNRTLRVTWRSHVSHASWDATWSWLTGIPNAAGISSGALRTNKQSQVLCSFWTQQMLNEHLLLAQMSESRATRPVLWVLVQLPLCLQTGKGLATQKMYNQRKLYFGQQAWSSNIKIILGPRPAGKKGLM